MDKKNVRVRFAPSPTGYLHVGGVRTALFNWLYAKHTGGKFILRIEDTDRARSTKEALDDILESMKWLGLHWDEGPFFQSERLKIYSECAEKLLEAGTAYKSDFVKPEQAAFAQAKGVEQNKPQGEAVVFRTTKETIAINDLTRGKIEFDASLIGDFVIMKSDGMPSYNFACVVDDALMNITHVIRGDDHISNTPKQIMLYRALGYAEPLFAHVPMILGNDGARLSKRHGAASVGEYRSQGYLPGALLNFLALLGWSPGEDKEVMSLDEMVERFGLDRIIARSAVFNTDKLTWMNSEYISALTDEEMTALCLPFLPEGVVTSKNLNKIIPLFKKRIKTLADIANATEYFFKDTIDFDPKAAAKFLSGSGGKSKNILTEVKTILEHISVFSCKEIEDALRGFVEKTGVASRELMQTIRVAVTGRTVSAGIFETMEAMGKEMVLKHLDQAIGEARSEVI